MSYITLIANTSDNNHTVSVPLNLHVQKRVEKFIYSQDINDAAVPLYYLENPGIDSDRDLQVGDWTFSVSTNSATNIANGQTWRKIYGKTYASQFRDALVTDTAVTGVNGEEEPLFYAHRLPDNTVSVDLYSISDGNKVSVASGFKVDLDKELFYTNYQNFFDETSGSYKLFYLIITTSDKTVRQEMLNPEPVGREADFQDLDSNGRLLSGLPVFTKEQVAGGYNFHFADAKTWYIRPMGTSLIQPIPPTGRDALDVWYMKFSNGDFSSNLNGSVRRYYLPEFNLQAFAPYKPYIYSPIDKAVQVTDRVLKFTRSDVKIDTSLDLDLTIFVRDDSDNLIRVWTTDQALHGQRYSNTNVFYESDIIHSWDNVGGFVTLGADIHNSWNVTARYYYEAKELEYTALQLNPQTHPAVLTHTYVFYVIPDVNSADTALHYLEVDRDGLIVNTSQAAGINYPNLQLKNSDGTYNTNTVIGMPYLSNSGEDSFTDLYLTFGANDFQYMLLSVISVNDFAVVDNQLVIDVRRPGAVLNPTHAQSAYAMNPRTLQSVYGYGEDGQTVPQDAVMVVDMPLSLQTDYGGNLNQTQAEDAVRRTAPANGGLVFNWVYPKAPLSVDWSIKNYELFADAQNDLDTDNVAQITATVTWVGAYTHRLLRRKNGDTDWTTLQDYTASSASTFTYEDSGLDVNTIYEYAVRVIDGTVEYPVGDILRIRTFDLADSVFA